jgi:hypothetical protein
MSQHWKTDDDDMDISDKVDQLEVELNRKIAGLDQKITRLEQNIARAALNRTVNEASSNANTPPATQASPGFFGWFKPTPTGGRSGYKKQKASSKRITSKRITRKRRR